MVEERGIPFMVLEFLKGEPLDERLKRDEEIPLTEGGLFVVPTAPPVKVASRPKPDVSVATRLVGSSNRQYPSTPAPDNIAQAGGAETGDAVPALSTAWIV